MNNYIENTSDVNDEARAVKPLQIAERMPQPVRRAMPAISDLEIGLRLNVPDGLETDGSHAYKYVTQVIDSHEGSGSAIRHDNEDGGR
jgi:hypothetical protein